LKKNTRNTRVFYRKNEQIRSQTIRLVGEDGKQIGVVSLSEGLEKARESQLDLVEIAPLAKPPVVRIIDYSKFLYQLKKKKQEEKKGAKSSETKEIRMGPFIDSHDLGIKLKKARGFLEEGNKVKFAVKFRGREITRKELGAEVLREVIATLADIAKEDREMHMEGRQLVLMMSKIK
jgi:translation initiation factor IF-3